jgi:hypothetical protein
VDVDNIFDECYSFLAGNNLKHEVNHFRFKDGPIINSLPLEDVKLLNSWLPHGKKIGTLLWRASKDGFEASTFHKKCDAANGSLTIITTDLGNKFGGYTSLSWEGNTGKADILVRL